MIVCNICGDARVARGARCIKCGGRGIDFGTPLVGDRDRWMARYTQEQKERATPDLRRGALPSFSSDTAGPSRPTMPPRAYTQPTASKRASPPAPAPAAKVPLTRGPPMIRLHTLPLPLRMRESNVLRPTVLRPLPVPKHDLRTSSAKGLTGLETLREGAAPPPASPPKDPHKRLRTRLLRDLQHIHVPRVIPLPPAPSQAPVVRLASPIDITSPQGNKTARMPSQTRVHEVEITRRSSRSRSSRSDSIRTLVNSPPACKARTDKSLPPIPILQRGGQDAGTKVPARGEIARATIRIETAATAAAPSARRPHPTTSTASAPPTKCTARAMDQADRPPWPPLRVGLSVSCAARPFPARASSSPSNETARVSSSSAALEGKFSSGPHSPALVLSATLTQSPAQLTPMLRPALRPAASRLGVGHVSRMRNHFEDVILTSKSASAPTSPTVPILKSPASDTRSEPARHHDSVDTQKIRVTSERLQSIIGRFGGGIAPCPACGRSVAPLDKDRIKGPYNEHWHQSCLRCGAMQGMRTVGEGCGKKLDGAARVDLNGRLEKRTKATSSGPRVDPNMLRSRRIVSIQHPRPVALSPGRAAVLETDTWLGGVRLERRPAMVVRGSRGVGLPLRYREGRM